VISIKQETSKTSPDNIRIAKLVIKTFIFGTAFPNTAKETLIRKFIAIKGAAINVPNIKTFETSLTNSSVGLTLRKKDPMGSKLKLNIKAFKTS
jgi:hypothetical protein